MDACYPHVVHFAALPYCYYDKYQKKVILRLISSTDVDSGEVIYGDPYIYRKVSDRPDAAWLWQYETCPLKLYYAGSRQMVWQAALDLPPWRRLKYGFSLQTARGDFYASEHGVFAYSTDFTRDPFFHYFLPYIHTIDAPEAPQWVSDTVWYQIFPERFYRGNPAISPRNLADWDTDEPAHRNFFGGDLAGVRQKLGYLQDLGITGLYLTPIFKAPSNHKYDTQDYFTIDEHFGDTEELKRLITEAHNRGIRVMLDGVFNHIGEQHPFWQDVLKNQDQSPYRDYFHIHRFPVKAHIDNPQDMGYDTFSFVPRMPKWNTENPQARRYLLDAALHWIRECDIDGWRLDVANEVSLDFWREFADEVRKLKKDFYILGEVWHDASPWINRGYFDATMNYPLGVAVAGCFLYRSIGPKEFTDRLVTALSRYSALHNSIAFNLLDSHDTERALTMAREDPQRLRNAFAMLLLLPGSPSIYYGTEIGMKGGKDPQNRRPMVWDETRQDQELLAFFRKLIALRRAHIGLINRSAISCRQFMSGLCWTFQDPDTGEALFVIYACLEPLVPKKSWWVGEWVFGTAIPENPDEIVPNTFGVFYRKEPPF